MIGTVVQPILSAGVEVATWSGLIGGMGLITLGGFGREYYLSYALWATFVGSVTSNWTYEFKMLDDIDSGRINAILVRPISFYEFYLSQFAGYKTLVAVSSLALPVLACLYFELPFLPARVPLTLLLLAAFLWLTHTFSFLVASLAFFMNRAYSLTGIKNLAIWVLAGEMIPLDLYPEPLRGWLIWSPFSAGVYIPVGYLTGRIDASQVAQSFWSIFIWGVIAALISTVTWRRGVREYAGTGA